MKDVKIKSTHLENLIWMSYRYCIGRHTIACSMHANTIFNILKDNPNIKETIDLDMMATDIRREIFNMTRHYPHMNSLFKTGHDERDVYSEYLINLQEMDCDTRSKLHSDYVDLINWVILANWLDVKNRWLVKTVNEKEYECIRYADYSYEDGKYDYVYVPIEELLNIGNPKFISKQFIIKAEKYENISSR